MAASLVPSFRCSHFVYADSTTDSWTTVTTNQELAEAFRYYCKSRNLAIEGSVADALTSFTTNTFNTICNTLGIDITALQAHLKRSTDSNGRIQFLFDEFGVTAYNRIFAEFLQNNNLEVGDEVDDQELYSGQFFVDKDGNGCLIFKFHSFGDAVSGNYYEKGTPYRLDTNDIISLTNSNSNHYSVECHLTTKTNWTFNSYKIGSFTSGNYTYPITYNTNSDAGYGFRWYSTEHWVNNPSRNYSEWKGYPIIYRDDDGGYYVGGYSQKTQDGTKHRGAQFIGINFSSDNVPSNTVIFITTNNNTINNNTYNDNKQTVINNEGDVYNYDYDDDDPPIDDPSGGGGGGGNDTPTDPDDWGIDLPDLNIDWLLTGKENKFPFNIPFNIILTLSLLNAEPEAPHFEGTIDLGVYRWNYEIDLEQFDPVAEVCRNFEFIAFLIGLMLLTKRLIWG